MGEVFEWTNSSRSRPKFRVRSIARVFRNLNHDFAHFSRELSRFSLVFELLVNIFGRKSIWTLLLGREREKNKDFPKERERERVRGKQILFFHQLRDSLFACTSRLVAFALLINDSTIYRHIYRICNFSDMKP